MATITCTTSAVSFTESASTVARDRVFTTTTEAVSFTESSAPINRTLHINPTSVEVIAFVENAAVVEIYRATIAVTSPSITVQITGEAGLLNTLYETATAREALGGGSDGTYTDIALVSDTLLSITTQSLTDVVNATDVITSDAGPTLHDTVNASESFAQTWTANISTGKWKYAGESFDFSLSEALTDVVNATDTQTFFRYNNLHDTGYVSNVLTPSGTMSNTLTSAVNASDSQVIGLGEAITDAANASDTQTLLVEPGQLFTDTATATDVLVESVAWYATLIDQVGASNQLIFGASVLHNTLTSTVSANDVIWAADLAAIAWVLNTETSGLSTYDNFEFSSLAWHDGVLYGVSPAGLFSLTGDDDQGRNIAANVKTGFLDLGSEQTKRISDLYVGYTGGELECDIESYDGPQEVYTYQLEERDANAPRNNRMKVGKGLSSRYWRFDLKNINGADFQLYNIEANIGRSKRRL